MGKRGSQGQSGGGKRWKGSAKQALTGPAIWATCQRNKEKKAADELIDFLEEITDRLYPGISPEDRPITPSAPEAYENSEDEMDAILNGGSFTSKPGASSSNSAAASEEQAETQSKPAENDLDIESQIQAELAELQAGKIRSGGKTVSTDKNGSGQKRKTKLKRFRSLDTDTECLLFIACSAPYDPYALVQALLEEVEKTGESRSRFVMRLTPISETCRVTVADIEAMAHRIVPPFFKAIQTSEETMVENRADKRPMGVGVVSKQLKPGPATFKVDVRNRQSSFSRDSLLSIVAGAVPKEGGHHADLKNAGRDGLMITVVILRNICSISVSADYDRFRKYNMLETAEVARKDAEEGRVAKGSSKSGPAVVAQEQKTVEEGKET